ncbi:hypothetical protein NLU13_2357 [Sarocladium strictum]|uniref:Suppressor of anucleate metulae protein B n=1 Tax=Sarocladium strictum TaxID=5046 RepID=A0AA39GU76_SARSR|nr:hypothetical protein NLU13_2357 [Sarocladium strictum]
MEPLLPRQRVKLDREGNAIATDCPPRTGNSTLTDAQAYGDRECACCSAAGCDSWCAGCDIQEVGKIRTFYCSRACQVKHRPDHKANCLARLHLARAASIVSELFLAFEKAAQITTTVKVSEKNGVATLGREEDSLRPRTGASLFVRFLEDALPESTPEKLVNSIALDQTCCETYAAALPLVSRLIEPFCDSIQVATACPKGVDKILYLLKIRSMLGDVGFASHTVLKIHTGDSEVLALDLAGRQCGWTDILYDWNTFAKHRTQESPWDVEVSSRKAPRGAHAIWHGPSQQHQQCATHSSTRHHGSLHRLFSIASASDLLFYFWAGRELCQDKAE